MKEQLLLIQKNNDKYLISKSEISERFYGIRINLISAIGILLVAVISLWIGFKFSYFTKEEETINNFDENPKTEPDYSLSQMVVEDRITIQDEILIRRITEEEIERAYDEIAICCLTYESYIQSLINEIYAWHQFAFTDELGSYYAKKSWYVGDRNEIAWTEFSAIEQQNLCVLISIRDELRRKK